MKKLLLFASFMLVSSLMWISCQAQSLQEDPSFQSSEDLVILSTHASYDARLDLFVFEIEVKGTAGKSVPKAFGKLDGAPVLGYVLPTSLQSTDVGFGKTEGIVALALTSHPDFDDTPIWDENGDQIFDNDGVVWHPHWVILTQDERVAGGLSVKQFEKGDPSVVLPPTNPGMPMYMDSPGFSVVCRENTIRVLVPAYRINNQKEITFDAVTAYMQVNTSDPNKPMLGVYKVYSVASGNLSLPYAIQK